MIRLVTVDRAECIYEAREVAGRVSAEAPQVFKNPFQ